MRKNCANVSVPKIYRIFGWSTMLCAIFALLLGAADLAFSLTRLSCIVYITAFLCCISLFATNFFAVKELKGAVAKCENEVNAACNETDMVDNTTEGK